MDPIQTEQRIREVIASDLGEKAARRARIERIETAHVVQLWERDGARRYTALVDGPEQLDAALSESREPFGTASEAVYRAGPLASVPSALAERVERILIGWGARADVDVRHAVEPVAVVRIGSHRAVVALGQRRVLAAAARRAATPVLVTLASVVVAGPYIVLWILVHARASLSVAWPLLLAASALSLAAVWVATWLRHRHEHGEA